ncbi:hypothetical protein M0R45_014966 [Rubus argutus]|uniref:Uncharacterized protein n=1 Tax=Rubus argutus TaxID=59490 RepID=A0AAW1XNA9_RUBAR
MPSVLPLASSHRVPSHDPAHLSAVAQPLPPLTVRPHITNPPTCAVDASRRRELSTPRARARSHEVPARSTSAVLLTDTVSVAGDEPVPSWVSKSPPPLQNQKR